MLGHQIVGTVASSARRQRFEAGERVGVPWLGWTCGACRYCRSGRENLCDNARFTGYDIDGGYAEAAVADERFCFPIPDGYPDLQAAPLLCAGLIGYRALRLAGDAERLGFYGFGAAAHIVCQVARAPGAARLRLHAAGRRGTRRRSRARSAPSGPAPRTSAAGGARRGDHLRARPASSCRRRSRAVAKGGSGRLRRDPHERHPLLPLRDALGGAGRPLGREPDPRRRRGVPGLAPRVPVRTEVEAFPLSAADEALARLRSGGVRGAAVLPLIWIYPVGHDRGMSTPQSGIFALGTASHAYLEFDAREPARRATSSGDRARCASRARRWAASTSSPASGPSSGARSCPTTRRRDVEGFNADLVGPDGYTMPATQHDAVLWLSGSAYDVVFDVARAAIAALDGVASVAEETSSWPYQPRPRPHRLHRRQREPDADRSAGDRARSRRDAGRRRHDPPAAEVAPRRDARGSRCRSPSRSR